MLSCNCIFSHFMVLLLALMVSLTMSKPQNLLRTQARLELKNLKCKAIDPGFSDFDYCYIKAVNRSCSYISLKVKLYKLPINNVTISVAFLKRANGYKPFLYNFTVDACKFLRAIRQKPVVNYFYQQFVKDSNMNHTCPYNHDLVVEKLTTKSASYFYNELLPMPTGDYAVYTVWSAYNTRRAEVNIYFSVTSS